MPAGIQRAPYRKYPAGGPNATYTVRYRQIQSWLFAIVNVSTCHRSHRRETPKLSCSYETVAAGPPVGMPVSYVGPDGQPMYAYPSPSGGSSNNGFFYASPQGTSSNVYTSPMMVIICFSTNGIWLWMDSPLLFSTRSLRIATFCPY